MIKMYFNLSIYLLNSYETLGKILTYVGYMNCV